MKVLVGMPAPDSWGGPAASEPPFIEALRQLGIDVETEIYVYGDKEKPTPLISRIRRVIAVARRFKERLQKQKFDLVHLNTAFDKRTVLRDAVSIYLMKPGTTRVFLKVHGSSASEVPADSLLYGQAVRYLTRHVDGIGVHTHEEMNDLCSLGFDAEKFYLVKNAIDIDERTVDGSLRRFKDPSECFELLFVSRFIETKGLLETIAACAILREGSVKFRLQCVGDGPIRGEAEALVRKMDLSDAVQFTGYVPEKIVFEQMLKSDIFVFPTSHMEGFPNALFRAVAIGLPVVTTRVRSGGEYLKEPKNCLFCSSDPQNIADRIAELINDRNIREDMSRNNREFGQQLTSVAVAKEFIEAYRSVCGREI